ncbi:hypothetical protein Ancab_012217 [Ancistrocladus abbreviatus]
MIKYLRNEYHMSAAKGTNILFYWFAASHFMPLVGAFVADSYLGRFLTIGLGSIICLLGMIVLWLTAVVPEAKPPPCGPSVGNCQSPTIPQFAFLLLAFGLISIGTGGVRSCSLAFGADQVDRRENPKTETVLETYFNWYKFTACLSVLIAFTVIVYIQEKKGWSVGFGIPAILMFLSALSFFMASSFYIKIRPGKSLFSSLAQALAAAYRNRKLTLHPQNSPVQYHFKDSSSVMPSYKFMFLNKACIIGDPDQDICLNGSAKNPWRLCTVEEVEGLKSFIKIIPIWSTGIIMSINLSQITFPLLQAESMNRHITQKNEIPAGCFVVFIILTMVVWIPLYDRVIIPLASKLLGRRVLLSVKIRMGLGLFCTFIAMMISGVVESIRRSRAIHEGHYNNGDAVVSMSAMWLVPQYCLNGVAEALNVIGQTEFHYSELPKSMSSIATCLIGLGMAVASMLASVIVNGVDYITKQVGDESWVASNVNKGHYDYYYWLLAALSFLNVFYYLVCSWSYGPLVGQNSKVADEWNGFETEVVSRDEGGLARAR